jgi:hypothetical protein
MTEWVEFLVQASLVINFGRERFSYLEVTLSCTSDCKSHIPAKGIHQLQDRHPSCSDFSLTLTLIHKTFFIYFYFYYLLAIRKYFHIHYFL